MNPHPLHLPDEKELFARMARGDESAFEVIFFHYTAQIRPFLMNITCSAQVAEELIQEIFLNLWLNRAKMTAIRNHRAYIFTASNNLLYTWLRKRARQLRVRGELVDDLPDTSQDPEETVDLKESMTIIEKAIGQLPPQKKLIWRLSRGQGLSHEEIGLQLGLSKNTVKNHLVAAIKSIRGYLDGQQGIIIITAILMALLKVSQVV